MYACKQLILNGGERRDRTTDAGLFRAGMIANQGVPTYLAVGWYRSVTRRGTVSTDMSVSVYKSSHLSGKPTYPSKHFTQVDCCS